MRIRVYEHPLPTDPSLAKTVVFELACPQAFSDYRDATWAILQLALESSSDDQAPVLKCLLRDYEQLSDVDNGNEAAVTLGSTTKSCTYPVGDVSRLFLR